MLVDESAPPSSAKHNKQINVLSKNLLGYKGHVNKIDELIDGEFDEYITASLNNAVEQLTRKMEKLSQIDEQLLKTFQNASVLETAVLDAEELQDEIMDKITRTKRHIELSTMKQPGRILPTQ